MFYHWITLSSMIILMLFIRRNLRLKTYAPKLTNDLDLHLEFDEDGKLFTRLYDKRDDFDFPIVNFPYLSSNIPESPAYGVFVLQLIRYARVCSKIWRFFVQRIYSGFKVIEDGIFFIFGNSMVVMKTLFTNVSHMCHICVTYVEWFAH